MKTLKILRSIVGDTQLDVQRKTGIADWKLSLFESGYKKPTRKELLALSDALGVTPNVLLDEEIIIKDGQVVTQKASDQ